MESIYELLPYFKGVKKCGNGFMARCPVPGHDDKKPSVHIQLSEDGTRILIHCFAGCTTEEIMSAIGLKMSDLFIKSTYTTTFLKEPKKYTYSYYDENGTLLYYRFRIEGDGKKTFYCEQPDGTKGIQGIERPLYNLPDVIKSDVVYFVEGEKCANALIERGYCATTLDSGANSRWLSDYDKYFEGKEVIIIPDNDEPGMKYAKRIKEHITWARIVPLPNEEHMEKGYDIADWFKDGKTMEEFMELPELKDNEKNNEEIVQDEYTQEKKSQAEKLLEIVHNYEIKLYVNQVNSVYVAVNNNEHKELWAIDSSFFSEWLQGIYYKECGKPIRMESVKQVISILSAKARFETGENVILFNRVAESKGEIWYDLSNKMWQAIKVTKNEWNVINNPPVLFERFGHQKEQVLPVKGGDIRKIFHYVNVKDNHTLFLCWLVSCFVPEIPHTISVIYGEKGAAKSTACTILKRLIDPSTLDTLTLQNDQRTLVVNLSNHWYLPFDNISTISTETSDMLCRAVTGGGVQQRKLCTNAEDYVFTFKRCISLNGISNVARRADLLDRSVLFELNRISEKDRKEIREIYSDFEHDRGSILGGIFDTLAKAMKIYDSVKLERLPRMADFAKWGYAIGEALGGCGDKFLEEYKANQQQSNLEVINSDIVAMLIVMFMEQRECWHGYAHQLLTALQKVASVHEIDSKSQGIPSQPNALTRRMGNIKSNLEEVGISFSKKYTSKGTQLMLKNLKISPLPPYDVFCGISGGQDNGDIYGDTNDDKQCLEMLSPCDNIGNNGINGDNGDNGDDFTEEEDNEVEF